MADEFELDDVPGLIANAVAKWNVLRLKEIAEWLLERIKGASDSKLEGQVKSLRAEIKEKQNELNNLTEKFYNLQRNYDRRNEEYYEYRHSRTEDTVPNPYNDEFGKFRWDNPIDNPSWPTKPESKYAWSSISDDPAIRDLTLDQIKTMNTQIRTMKRKVSKY